MPRTFVSTKKRYVDDALIEAGNAFTTSAYDGLKKLPEDLTEQKADADDGQGDSGSNTGDKALADMTVAQLRKVAKDERIDNISGMNKEALVMAIESMREQNARISDTSTNEGTGLAVPAKSASDVTPV